MSTVEFFGETFDLQDEPNTFALMEFAEAASTTDDNSLEGLAAVFRLVEAAVTAEDWPRFKALARKNKAGVEDVLPVAVAVFQAQTGRPTVRSSDSSDGPSDTEQSSTSDSLIRVLDREAGRPDRQLAILKMHEAQQQDSMAG